MSPRRPKEVELDSFSWTLAKLVAWAESQGLPLEHVGFKLEYGYYDEASMHATELSGWRKKKAEPQP